MAYYKILKRLFFVTFILYLTCLYSSCNKEDIGGNEDVILQSPDGTRILEATYNFESGKIFFIAHTTDKDYYPVVWLDFYFPENSTTGKELKIIDAKFGVSFSSVYHEETDSFSGKVLLKEKGSDSIVLRMRNIKFKISGYEYIIRGDLKASKSEIAYTI